MTDFLGRGLRFPLLPDATGRLGYVDGDAGVAQSLYLLMATACGERTMRPSLGNEAPNLVFAPGSAANLSLLETSIRDAVRDHEPRVQLVEVEATPDDIEAWRVNIEVTYTVRRSNTRTSVVFPYYLPRTDSPT